MRTVCVTLQRMRVERRVFYPKISKRSWNVQHCICTQKVAMHYMFNIKEFQACFSTLYYTISKCIFNIFCNGRAWPLGPARSHFRLVNSVTWRFWRFLIGRFKAIQACFGGGAIFYVTVVPYNFLNSEDVTTIDVTFSDVSFADVTFVDVIIFDVYKLWRHIHLQ